jgi:hypothetical protein
MFAWNMQYPGPTPFWGMNDIGTDGPMALPGRYRVRLEVGGKAYEQPFRLLVDPRSRVTPADLREQFTFLERVRDTVNAVTTTVIWLRNARSQLEGRAQALGAGSAARGQVEALAGKLRALEDSLYQVRLQSDEDNLVYASRPVERIASLFYVAGGYDARPTDPTYQVFRLFAPDVQRELLAAQAALAGDLGTVNAALAAAGQQPVTPGAAELRAPRPVD